MKAAIGEAWSPSNPAVACASVAVELDSSDEVPCEVFCDACDAWVPGITIIIGRPGSSFVEGHDVAFNHEHKRVGHS